MKIILSTKRKDSSVKNILHSFGVSDDLIETYETISFEFDSIDLKVDKKTQGSTDKLRKILKE